MVTTLSGRFARPPIRPCKACISSNVGSRLDEISGKTVIKSFKHFPNGELLNCLLLDQQTAAKVYAHVASSRAGISSPAKRLSANAEACFEALATSGTDSTYRLLVTLAVDPEGVVDHSSTITADDAVLNSLVESGLACMTAQPTDLLTAFNSSNLALRPRPVIGSASPLEADFSWCINISHTNPPCIMRPAPRKAAGSHSAMIPERNAEYLADLVANLRRLPQETEWVEFKVNQATEPQPIGEYISALANGAALNGETTAYMLWGIENASHAVVGTEFNPDTVKQGNASLEHWLRLGLTPRIDFRFHETVIDGKQVVILEIEPTTQQPVAISGKEYIRVGDVKTELRNHPEKERALWQLSNQTRFEEQIAFERASDDDVLSTLNCPAYFDRLGVPLPDGRAAIFDRLRENGLILPSDAGGWNITNLAAVLFARNLNDFPRIGRKSLRVVQYRGDGRIETQREQEFAEGYAVIFDAAVDYIMAVTPANEVIEQALRRAIPMFPSDAVRELVANTLIHQDFSVSGAGPTVSIFDTRIEIANPGEPLVPTERFVDAEPRSRMKLLHG